MINKQSNTPKSSLRVKNTRSVSISTSLPLASRTSVTKVGVSQTLDSSDQNTSMQNSPKKTTAPAQSNTIAHDIPPLAGDSGIVGTTAADLNSEISLANMLNEIPLTPDGANYRRLLEEVALLKKEVDQKNMINERLMRENEKIRHELEEFLATVEDARRHIDVELKESAKRIQELEAEIQLLKTENRMYKEQATSKGNSLQTSTQERMATSGADEDVEEYYGKAKKGMDEFYLKLNEQIIEFMDMSKKQYQKFNTTIASKITNGPKEERLATFPGSPEKAQQTSSKPSSTISSPVSNHNRILSNSMSCKAPKTPNKSKGAQTNKPKAEPSSKISNQKVTKQSADFTTDNSYYEDHLLDNNSKVNRISYSSANQAETEIKANILSPTNYSQVSRKSCGTGLIPPNSSLLRSKLKSDKILQEMKKKLGGGSARE